jgi:16S rRNA (uracil1498-N3)-methyltransferase
MGAPLFLLPTATAASAQPGGTVVLDGPEGRHAVTVSRIAVGERIDLTDGAGVVLHADVQAIEGRQALRARVIDRQDVPPPAPRLVVVQALPKGDRADTAVETLTEVGVDVIVPWQSQRAVARWSGERAVRGRARWEAVARAAGKQSRRARLPEVAPLARTADVAALVAGASAAVVLHEEATAPLGAVQWPAEGDIVLVVGPEGGVSPAEVVELTAAGARPARMGPTVLRTSTAGTVAAAVVLSRTARWT